jgi:hypothetical protein
MFSYPLGVWFFKQKKKVLNKFNFRLIAIFLCVHVRFVLAAHGVMAERRKKDNFFKPSVEGMLENFLSGYCFC